MKVKILFILSMLMFLSACKSKQNDSDFLGYSIQQNLGEHEERVLEQLEKVGLQSFMIEEDRERETGFADIYFKESIRDKEWILRLTFVEVEGEYILVRAYKSAQYEEIDKDEYVKYRADAYQQMVNLYGETHDVDESAAEILSEYEEADFQSHWYLDAGQVALVTGSHVSGEGYSIELHYNYQNY